MQTAQAQPRDFNIPAPNGTRAAQPSQQGAPANQQAAPVNPAPRVVGPPPAPATQQGFGPSFAGLTTVPSTAEIAVGAGIVAVLAIVFFFVRGAVKSHLVRRRATRDAASGAGWMLFAALFLTALTVVSGTIGHVWGQWMITVPALAICAIAFLIFFVMFARAPSQTR